MVGPPAVLQNFMIPATLRRAPLYAPNILLTAWYVCNVGFCSEAGRGRLLHCRHIRV